MKFSILVAALLCASPALASKHKHRHHAPRKHEAPLQAIQYCGPMGEESMECVADELKHGRSVMVSVECDDGAAGMVLVSLDGAGEIRFNPPSYTDVCK